MQGKLDSSFQTVQRDIFESGLVAEIGANAFAVWCAIKAHADYNKGVCWPSVRRLMDLTGLASATVQRGIRALEEAFLLRREAKGRRVLYVARERMDVRLGDRLLCTLVVDYVPARLRAQLKGLKEALETGESDPDMWAQVEVLPGPGLSWDGVGKCLRGQVRAAEVPPLMVQEPVGELAKRVSGIREAQKQRLKSSV
jgi:hypothetical protein